MIRDDCIEVIINIKVICRDKGSLGNCFRSSRHSLKTRERKAKRKTIGIFGRNESKAGETSMFGREEKRRSADESLILRMWLFRREFKTFQYSMF